MAEDYLELAPAPDGEEVVFDYASLGLMLRRHPMEILRPQLEEMALMTAEELRHSPHRRVVKTCGIVTTR